MLKSVKCLALEMKINVLWMKLGYFRKACFTKRVQIMHLMNLYRRGWVPIFHRHPAIYMDNVVNILLSVVNVMSTYVGT